MLRLILLLVLLPGLVGAQPRLVQRVDGWNPALLNKRDATLNEPLKVTVCASGCDFPDPLTAWNTFRGRVTMGPFADVTIQVADGTYALADKFYTDQPDTAALHIKGNVGDPGRVVFNFTNIAGTNGSGFVAERGGRIGQAGNPGVDGVTILGTGARTGVSSWKAQSFGAGAHAAGSGSNIQFGAKVIVDGFYYGVLADQGGRFVGSGATYRNAGDSNLLARFGGVIECQGCALSTASHVFVNAYGSKEVLGHNALAEGGVLYIDGSSVTGGQVACVSAHTNGLAWAHAVKGTGCANFGVSAQQGGFVEAGHSRFTGGGVGLFADTHGGINADGVELDHNTLDGLKLDGGYAFGTALNIHDNRGYGIRIEKQGEGKFYKTGSMLLNNAAGRFYVQQASGCTGAGVPCSPASTLIID